MYPRRVSMLRLAMILAFAATIVCSTQLAAQPPSLPHLFYGPVTVHGAAAPMGTVISAQTASGRALIGAAGNPITTTAAGQYGGPEVFASKLIVQGVIADGEAIFFFVNSVQAEVRVVGQTAWLSSHPFRSGEVTNLELNVVERPTTTPTATRVTDDWIDLDRAIHACCQPGPGCIFQGDTTNKPNNAEYYGDGTRPPIWAYTGGEDVYIVDITRQGNLEVRLDSLSADLAIFLLWGPHPVSLLAWGERVISRSNLAPGRYYVVVDGVNGYRGPYVLTLVCSSEPTVTPTLTSTPSATVTVTPTRTSTPTPTHTVTPSSLSLPLILRYSPTRELAYDDGAREAWAGGAQGSVMAVRYPISPPARVHSARFFLGGEMRPMRFIVWNGAWQELYSQTLTPNAPSGGGWWTWTLPAGVVGPQGEVYVGYQCLSDYVPSGPWVGFDTSQPKGETYAGPWPPQRRTDGNAMVRVVVQ